jgi:hypothetical protein
VSQLSDEQVWWRPQDGMNSIANLLLHLTGNLKQRFGSVIGGEPDVRNRPAEFTERRPIAKQELLAGFDAAVKQADEVLASLTPERLGESCRYEVLAGPIERSVLGVIFQTQTHFTGHAQEILHLTRGQLGESYAFRTPTGVPSSPKVQK